MSACGICFVSVKNSILLLTLTTQKTTIKYILKETITAHTSFLVKPSSTLVVNSKKNTDDFKKIVLHYYT